MGNSASTVHAIGDEIGRGANAVTSSIIPPNYFLTFILPFAIVSLLGYIIGWSYYNKSTGFTYKQIDKNCEYEVKRNCRERYSGSSNTDMNLRNRCYDNNKRSCPSTEKKTSKGTVLLVYIFVPIIIGLIIASFIYQSALYYKNPKAAALITTTKITRDVFRGGRNIRKRYKK